MLQSLIHSKFIYWILLFLTVAVMDFGIMILAWKKQQKLHMEISRIMLAAMLTTVFYTGSIAYENYFISSCFSSLYFIGVDLILVFMLLFVEKFSENSYFDTFSRMIKDAGAAWFFIDILMLLINPFYEISIHYVPALIGNHTIYKYRPYLPYRLHLVFCYLLVAIIVCMLVRKIVQTPYIFHKKYGTILLVFILDVVLNFFYLFGSEYVRLDISVLFYSLSGALVYSSIFSFIPRALLNTTRNYIMEFMDSPIVIFDYEERVIDSNRKARTLFPELTPERQNTDFAVNMKEYFTEKNFPPFQEKKTQFEWHYHKDGEELHYQCQRHDFKDDKNRLIGRMLMLQDISYRKDFITGLDLTPGLYRHLGIIGKEAVYPIQLLAVNINGLGLINSALGHDKGNMAMAKTAEIMQHIIGRETYIAKLENGTFVSVLPKATPAYAADLGNEIRSMVGKDNSLGFKFEIEYGVSEVNKKRPDIFDALNEVQMSLKNRKLLSESSHDSSVINSLTQTLLESDYETEAHVKRTKQASRILAKVLGLSDKETSELALLCILHDIGKTGIPTEILLKPGRLTDDEWEIMKTHTEKGYRIAMASPELRPISKLVLHHHEKWDGTGYPDHLKGEEIPLLSRIITVLDSFDVMTHDRPYHKAISVEAAREELLRCSGTQFDPHIVNAFLPIADEIYDT